MDVKLLVIFVRGIDTNRDIIFSIGGLRILRYLIKFSDGKSLNILHYYHSFIFYPNEFNFVCFWTTFLLDLYSILGSHLI